MPGYPRSEATLGRRNGNGRIPSCRSVQDAFSIPTLFPEKTRGEEANRLQHAARYHLKYITVQQVCNASRDKWKKVTKVKTISGSFRSSGAEGVRYRCMAVAVQGHVVMSFV
ncbi:hypothetical protein Sfum_3198 [Syntrophobacter fumaroxidans MPOB]|uniref:Uncharacterized protein n=1 Tax=Syntrophobacter fumaroxidans (strain DSM 10017 / MPOB) TaxID=335543 RepID=A0LN69_SYNFM|nr:hypothetical protein Sfum_3198 [Syntrophobacter fumaroxidans MPOB]